MEQVFPFRDIEKKWQKIWKDLNIDNSLQDAQKEKMYVLEMLPYPSGKIHMGHVRNYTIGDVIARYFKLQGKNVFHPIGWDSFGLPAENAAINKGINPKDWTYKNIDDMKAQLKEFGLSYDWNTELATCSPEYYKWNQWLFAEMFKKGLAYKKYAKVNFCPSCQTVLANEQVINSQCWRCSSIIEMKPLSQWYLAITQYSKPLLEQHEQLKSHWPDRVLNMQENWIGESVGAEIDFHIQGYNKSITIFTSKPETLFGATYIALAPENPFIQEIISIQNNTELSDFIEDISTQNIQDRTNPKTKKQGVFTGFFALHPFTKEPLPIYTANFVLPDYGDGAIMGVPAHDKRDAEFAKAYDIPIKIVVENQEEANDDIIKPIGTLIHSEKFSGLTTQEASIRIVEELEEIQQGQAKTNYKLRDWLISRQRYWGTPIPIIYCPTCGPVLVPEKDLPVLLPTDIEFKVGENPLLSSPTFLETNCPQCGIKAQRETDTMDTFFDSSWYFLRYTDPKNTQEILDPQKSQYWLPVDYYIGGIEHAVLHLLYARFFYYIFEDLGFVKGKEPFTNLITQGMVLSNSYYCSECKIYYTQENLVDQQCPKHKSNLITKMEKMSKSKNNGVDPEGLLKEYGADASRLFTLFAAPIDRDLEWNESGVMGCLRFLKRLYFYCQKYNSDFKKLEQDEIVWDNLEKPEKDILKKLHQAIAKIEQEMKDFSYNTVIATLMEFLNSLENYNPDPNNIQSIQLTQTILVNICILLFPMAPHTAEECYSLVGGSKKSIAYEQFPTFNPLWIQDQEVTYAIQINGKLKANLTVDIKTNQQMLEDKIKEIHSIQKALEDHTIIKIIFVEGKILNLVVKPL